MRKLLLAVALAGLAGCANDGGGYFDPNMAAAAGMMLMNAGQQWNNRAMQYSSPATHCTALDFGSGMTTFNCY